MELIWCFCALVFCAKFLRRNNVRTITKCIVGATVFVSAAVLATDSAPSGFQIDNTSGNTKIGDIVSGTHKTYAVAAGRAEWRCKPSNTACSKNSGSIYFKKKMTVYGGENISLVQFLNIKGSGTSGGSEPISQLTVDDQKGPSTNRTYRVSIEQGNYDCGFRINKKQEYEVEAGIDKNGVGWFKVGGQWCQRDTSTTGSKSRKAGYPESDSYSGVNTYYLKYGAYNANSNTTESSVRWR